MRLSLLAPALCTLFTLGLSGALLSGCESDKEEQATGSGTAGAPGHTGGHDHHPGGCKEAANFKPNAVVGQNSTHRLTVIKSEPAVPQVVSKDNVWVLKLETLDGQPVSNASFPTFSPRMPEHNHGVAAEQLISVVADPSSGPGIYRANKLTFTMSGYWKTTVNITLPNPDGSTTKLETIELHTCLGKE